MRRQDRRFGAVAVTYAFTVAMLSSTLPTPLYALYRQRYGFSELMITVIYATYAAGVIAALLLFGRLSDDIGRRLTLLPGLVLAVLSAVAFLSADGLGLLLVGRVLSGLSAGIFTGTATAALVDFAGPEGRERATLVATMANMGGLGLGPLLAGALVQWAGMRLRLAFWVDLGLLVPAIVAVLSMSDPVQPTGRGGLRPQALAVPPQMRGTFVRAGLAGFAGFAVTGLFSAVSPAFLAEILHQRSHLLLGATVFAVFASSTVGQLALARFPGRVAFPAGVGLLIAGVAVLALSLAVSSLVLLLIGAVITGFGQGLSFRAGLAGLNQEAPADRRAAVASSFFVVAYVALSVPVIGEGLLAQAAGLRAAGLIFTAAVALLAAVVLAMVGGTPR